MDNILTSKIVERQLPDFVRGDHPKFVSFLKKYYEWLETNAGVEKEIKNLNDSIDIDNANSYYLTILRRDLLPYFPEDILADKRLFLKLVANFYKSSGTQESLKFLFRILYNDDITIYYPKDDILKTSNGKWVLPLALRIETNDDNIFNIEKTKIIGNTSKASAIVEKVLRSVDRQLGIVYTELYISNIQRLFRTGETITATYRTETANVTVEGKVVGALSEIKIDPQNRGTGYTSREESFPGDPVTIIGGLNPDSANPIGAVAYVGKTTTGSVSYVEVLDGGFGFRLQSESGVEYDDEVTTLDFRDGFGIIDSVYTGSEAEASLQLIDDTKVRNINVSLTKIETIQSIAINAIANMVGSVVDANTADPNSNNISYLIEYGAYDDAYQSFNVYPISFVSLDTGGGGYRSAPTLKAYSFYNETNSDNVLSGSLFNAAYGTNIIPTVGSINFTNYFEIGDYVRMYKPTGNGTFEDIHKVINVTSSQLTLDTTFKRSYNDFTLAKILKNDLYKLGSIGLIKINTGGSGYSNGNVVVFSGGSGYGANAYVNVNATGAIVSVTMNAHSSGAYLLGGEGYTRDSLPTLTVSSTGGAGASLSVAQILGDGDIYGIGNNRIGSVTSLYVESFGYDYVSEPIVSLRNMDLEITNISPEGEIFQSNTRIYQGPSNTAATFIAYIDKFTQQTSTTGFLRLFNYRGTINESEILKTEVLEVGDIEITAEIVAGNTRIYGDGRAKANAEFENGLIRYPGLYLNDDGFLSSNKYLQGKNRYHNFSYEINTETDYEKFRKPVYDLVHPVGSKILINRVLKTQKDFTPNSNNLIITINQFAETFNITYNSNIAVSTNATANLLTSINVGDTVIFTGVYKPVQNVGNVVSSSNVVFGANCNFINDVNDGDVLFLANTLNSAQNTFATVESVSNSSYLILEDEPAFTANVSINVYFDEVKTITNVATNSITLDSTIISSNAKFVTINIQKVK